MRCRRPFWPILGLHLILLSSAVAFCQDKAAVVSPEARGPLEHGVRLFREGEYREAYLGLAEWLEQHPEDASARLLAAVCAVRLGRLPRADQWLEGLSAEEPRVRLLRGEIAVIRMDSEEAISLLEPLVADHPPGLRHELYRLLGRAYLGAQRPADVITLLAQATAEDDVLALLLAEAHYYLGDPDAAVDVLLPHGKVGGDVAPELGRYLVATNRPNEALPYLRRAAEHTPDEASVWLSLSQALFAVGEREEAATAAGRARQIRASGDKVSTQQEDRLEQIENPREHGLRRALRLRRDGDLGGALALVREEIVMAPDATRMRMVESTLLFELGRFEEAERAASEAIEREPERGDGYFHRGRSRMALDELAGAEADFRKTIARSPGHLGARNQLAVLLARTGRIEDAIDLLEEILAAQPDNAIALENLALVREQGGGR